MASVTGFFKRARSKSEKAHTPPKVVFRDLGSAYASIAQRSTPSTPNLRPAGQGTAVSPPERDVDWSPVQSPQSEESASAPLLKHISPDALRLSYLSGDFALPKDFGTSPTEQLSSQGPEPLGTSGPDRSSVNTLNFKKHILDSHFGLAGGEGAGPTSENGEGGSPRRSYFLSSSEYPELTADQLEACSKLAGADGIDLERVLPLDRCGTIQSIATRHEYGEVGTNGDIHSVRGSHVQGEGTKDEQEVEHLGAEQRATIEEVQWSPRPSSELYVVDKGNLQEEHASGSPPAIALPQTPKGKGVLRYGELQDFSSPTEQVSHSSGSYGNTRKLLDLSVPRIRRAASQHDDFFEDLLKFAREGQPSSSSKSFATFSIKEANGNLLTRPVSQGEFQHLEKAISFHLRRESQATNLTAVGDFQHVGQISLDFPEGSEARCGPGGSQTASSSEWESDIDIGLAIQPALRTRNGTPPLLFRSPSNAKKDTDWETVGNSYQTTSSVADYSDSVSRSPAKELLSVDLTKVLKHPTHPRYNHSWDLQQNLQSGGYVLTPRHKVSNGISLPNGIGVAPLSVQGARKYSHPAPLRLSHSHPFASSAPQIAPSRVVEPGQHFDVNTAGHVTESRGSSGWLSTAAASTSRFAASSSQAHQSPAAIKAPPLPTRNPYRQMRKAEYTEELELQPLPASRARGMEEPTRETAREDTVSRGPGARNASLSSYATTKEATTSTTSSAGLAQPATAVLADAITPPRRHVRPIRRYSPMPHPVYGNNPLAELPSLRRHNPAPRPIAAVAYEQRVARRYLKICACLPILLPLYATGALDFLMRLHTRGVTRELPKWEKRASWGLLAAWIVVALCVVPFSTFLHYF